MNPSKYSLRNKTKKIKTFSVGVRNDQKTNGLKEVIEFFHQKEDL